jgi:hypothetical protein
LPCRRWDLLLVREEGDDMMVLEELAEHLCGLLFSWCGAEKWNGVLLIELGSSSL